MASAGLAFVRRADSGSVQCEASVRRVVMTTRLTTARILALSTMIAACLAIASTIAQASVIDIALRARWETACPAVRTGKPSTRDFHSSIPSPIRTSERGEKPRREKPRRTGCRRITQPEHFITWKEECDVRSICSSGRAPRAPALGNQRTNALTPLVANGARGAVSKRFHDSRFAPSELGVSDLELVLT